MLFFDKKSLVSVVILSRTA